MSLTFLSHIPTDDLLEELRKRCEFQPQPFHLKTRQKCTWTNYGKLSEDGVFIYTVGCNGSFNTRVSLQGPVKLFCPYCNLSIEFIS
jgi:hypothetical protein